MDQVPQLAKVRRAVRILHTALCGGLFLSGAMLYLVRHVLRPPAVREGRVLALPLAVVAAVLLGVAVGVLRPKVPDRRPEQGSEAYWSDVESRGPALMLWASIEGAGLIGAVGYFLTGAVAPAGAFALALAALVLLGPGRLEGDGAA
jgi:hypothetical protein